MEVTVIVDKESEKMFTLEKLEHANLWLHLFKILL